MVPVAVETVLASEDRTFGPVVLYGPLGVGKTHLASGLTAAWKSLHRQAAAYMPALDFARELDDAVETQTTADLRNRLLRLGFLAIDDVEYLASKESAQRELTSILDGILENGGRVVATCSALPSVHEGLLPSLVSRLSGGLAVPIVPPKPDTRVAVVDCLAEWKGVAVEEPAAYKLALAVPGGVAALWSVVSELAMLLEPGRNTIDIDMVEGYFESQTAPKELSLRDIAAATAKHFAVKMADLRSPSRRRAVVTARDVAMYLARTLTGKSFKQIGLYFDGRDHTTVSHGFSKTEELVRTDPTIREAVRRLCERLGVSCMT